METVEKLNDLQNYLSNKDQKLFNITSNKSDIKINFTPPIELNSNRNYKLGLLWFSAYNTIFNVDKTNNRFEYYDYTGKKQLIVLDPGCYEIIQINTEIQRQMQKQIKDQILNKLIKIELDKSTSKSILSIPEGMFVSCDTENSILQILGFNKANKKISGYVKSDNIINIIKISTINIECNLVSGSYLNGTPSNILYSFPSYSVPVGFKILEKITHPVYLPINKTSMISHMKIRIVDENNNLINFNGEEICMSLELKQV